MVLHKTARDCSSVRFLVLATPHGSLSVISDVESCSADLTVHLGNCGNQMHLSPLQSVNRVTGVANPGWCMVPGIHSFCLPSEFVTFHKQSEGASLVMAMCFLIERFHAHLYLTESLFMLLG